MKKGVIIAVAIMLALLAAAGVMLSKKQKEDSPPVRIIEDAMDTNTNNVTNADDIILSQNAQIAELRAQVEKLEQEKGQSEFDRTALKAEQDRLQKQLAALEEQNKYLRGRNSSLSDEEQKLKGDIAARDNTIAEKDKIITDRDNTIAEKDKAIADIEKAIAEKEKEISELEGQIAALNENVDQMEKEHAVAIASLNEQLDKMDKEREENEAAYQEALARIEEYEAKAAVTQASLEKDNTSGTRVADKTTPAGQSRNLIGIKAGETDLDLEIVFALMPHWFLIIDGGITGVPSDLVQKEFPGLKADHAYMYPIMFGTGFNWRVNSLHGQPNFYISTMLGPVWFRYLDRYNDEEGVNTYLLWRSSVGFDLTLYKNLQFTADVGVDWMEKFELTPRVTLGLQWNFSDSWSFWGK